MTTEAIDGADPDGDTAVSDGRDGDTGRAWSRRGLIAGVAAAGIGAAAALAADGSEAGAANGGPVLLGEANSATASTSITTTTGDALSGTSSAFGGAGVYGTSSGGLAEGVYGYDTSSAASGSFGVFGSSARNVGTYGLGESTSGISVPSTGGVVGDSSSGAGVTGLSSANNGVYGETTSDLINNSGVCGQDSSTSGGFGVNGESQSGVGVYGLSRGGDGVQGTVLTSNWAGVHGIGTEVESTGVWGQAGGASTSLTTGLNAGVFGDGGVYVGVIGHSTTLDGIDGQTTAAGRSGVAGTDASTGGGVGVTGASTAGTGVAGTSTSGHGVVATGGLAPLLLTPAATPGAPTAGAHSAGELYVDSHGVLFQCTTAGTPGTWVPVVTTGALSLGEANAASATTSVTTSVGIGLAGATSADGGDGVAGTDTSTAGGTGVSGMSTAGVGVSGSSSDATGVVGAALGVGAGVKGLSTSGYGMVGTGGLAPLVLTPAAAPGAPTTGDHVAGALYTDSVGALFLCAAAGTPGTWVQLSAGTAYANGAFCLLPAPIRLLDTRLGATDAVSTPGIPVVGDSTLTLQVTGAVQYSISIPTGAVAVIGNVTAVNALARGYLTLWPYGVTKPSTSSLNYPEATSVANGVTVALSSTEGQLDIFASQTTDVIFDATGFIA